MQHPSRTEGWRIGRRRFAAWTIVLGTAGNGAAFMIGIIALMFIGFGGDDESGGVLLWIAIAVAGVVHLALAALAVCRLWDAGRSAWWVLPGAALLVPVYWGHLYLLALVWLAALGTSTLMPSASQGDTQRRSQAPDPCGPREDAADVDAHL